jgi:hypothetical protein
VVPLLADVPLGTTGGLLQTAGPATEARADEALLTTVHEKGGMLLAEFALLAAALQRAGAEQVLLVAGSHGPAGEVLRTILVGPARTVRAVLASRPQVVETAELRLAIRIRAAVLLVGMKALPHLR